VSFSFASPQTRVGTFVVCPVGHFLKDALVLALLRYDNESVLQHQPFCPITFPLIGMSRSLSCAHCHRLVSPLCQSILCFTSGNDLVWEYSNDKLSKKLSMCQHVNVGDNLPRGEIGDVSAEIVTWD
jgi:hypothetical protein